MAVQDHPAPVGTEQDWYARTADEVADGLRVDVEAGLSADDAAERLRTHGPNALPERTARSASTGRHRGSCRCGPDRVGSPC
jgi:magnesium-transporting ATPase (P-type)